MTHRLGSNTGSGCKYRELVLEIWQGAILNRYLPRMRRKSGFLWREVELEKRALISGVNSLSLLPSF